MKITNIRLAKLTVPLVTPFKTALRSVDYIDDLVVIIETDTGDIGYGSAPSTPLITGDTHASMIEAITNIIKPRVLGFDIANLSDITTVIQQSIINNYSAKAAVEIAVYDLWGKLKEKPLYKLLGGSITQLKTDITISVNDTKQMIHDSLKAVEQGFDILKVKVGKDINQDIERIENVYQAVKGAAQIRLDVNQGWTAKQTLFAIEQLDRAGVVLELIEQPVKANDLAGMRLLTEQVSTAIMADESAFNARQVEQIIESKAADIINIKLMKSGGLSGAIEITKLCAANNIECMIGCMLEGSIAVAAAAHLASAKSTVITKIDLDGPALGQFDPVQGGVDFNFSHINLNNGPGLGIEKITELVYL